MSAAVISDYGYRDGLDSGGGSMTDKRTYLKLTDVARILGQEKVRREGGTEEEIRDAPPLKDGTVSQYLLWSKPAPPGTKSPRHYVNHPMPKPTYRLAGRLPIWEPGPGQTIEDVVEELRVWYRTRPQSGPHRRGLG